MSKPKRVQLSRKKGYRKPKNAVNVARPTKWGNPFSWQAKIEDGYTEKQAKQYAVEAYEEWLVLPEANTNSILKERRQWILDHIHKLKGKDLACWCRLCNKHKEGKPIGKYCQDCEPCHCEPLGKIAKELVEYAKTNSIIDN